MNDTGTRKGRQLRRMMKECVQQRPVAVAAARMDNQARRLVDNDNGVVFVNEGKLERVRRSGGRDWILPRLEHNPLAAVQPPLALRDRAIERDAALIDPILESTAGMLRNQPRERLVEAQPGEIGRDRKLEPSLHGIIPKRCDRSAII